MSVRADGDAAASQAPRVARLAAPSLVLAALLTAMLAGGQASSAAARPTLPVIERQVMCVTCKIPLNVAQSLQADRERAFIQGLIAEGRSESQIKSELVEQYGPTVLGLPSTHGFDLAAYLVPLAVVIAMLALLALLLPRWRRRPREDPDASGPPELDPGDTARLDADLARFE